MPLSKTSPLTIAALLLPLCSCIPTPTDTTGGGQFKVTSAPSGASVYVMDELLGVTPLEIAAAKVFPIIYPPDKQHLYGHVVLLREGCDKETVQVSMHGLARGLRVRLVCQTDEEAAASGAGAESTPQARGLQALQGLRRDGFITEQEYNKIKQRIRHKQ